jgi:hypothetical protein
MTPQYIKLNLAVACVAAVAGVIAAVTGTRHRGGNLTRASTELNSGRRLRVAQINSQPRRRGGRSRQDPCQIG